MRSIEESAVGVVGNSVSMSCAATYVENVYPGTKTTINWYRYEAPDIPLAGSTMESEVIFFTYLRLNNSCKVTGLENKQCHTTSIISRG